MKYKPTKILNVEEYHEKILKEIEGNGGMCLKTLNENRLKDVKKFIRRSLRRNQRISKLWWAEYNFLQFSLDQWRDNEGQE